MRIYAQNFSSMLRKFSKNSKSEKFERFNRFWPNSIPKFLDRYSNIYVCSFRTITRILRKLELPHPFSKNLKSHKIKNRASIVMRIVTIKGLWLLHWCTKFHIDISSRLWIIGLWNVENQTHMHTHKYIPTPAKNHISRRFRLFWVLRH